MGTRKPQRNDRRYGGESRDQRSHFQRDRDRVLYSSAFQRLAGVTQIVKAGEESVFHTRQQHTIKVAQVGRRLAEKLTAKNKPLRSRLDPDVVEAACLIHDLGHPPFGHAGEKVLDRLVVEKGTSDGFEGNAQSFRIITKLAVHKDDWNGLNLTRATLAATLKYPWFRGPTGSDRHEKWSAYQTERVDFEFAVEQAPGTKTIEAELMDWADDIAYSVHDLEDFHRCSVIPWKRVFSREGKADLLRQVKAKPGVDPDASYEALHDAIMPTFGDTLEERYEGTRIQRWVLRNLTSNLINLYVSETRVSDDAAPTLIVPPAIRGQIDILKQITRDHVIRSPSLAAQQVGYRKIITDLFNNFHDHPDGDDAAPPFTPVRLQYLWDLRDGNRPRFAADCVAALSEPEAVGLYARLNGINSGSVLDPIVR